MGQKLGQDNIAPLVRASNTQITMAATHNGKPVRITVGGQQYKAPASGLALSISTSGFNGIDTGSYAIEKIYNVFAVVQSGVLGLVYTLATTPSGFSAYTFLGTFISSSTASKISHVMNVGEPFVEYAYPTGTWDADTATSGANTGYDIEGFAAPGALTGNRTKYVKFLVNAKITDRIEPFARGGTLDNAWVPNTNYNAYQRQGNTSYGMLANPSSSFANIITWNIYTYASPGSGGYGAAGNNWITSYRIRLDKYSDIITVPLVMS
jgi:hypothetical protein